LLLLLLSLLKRQLNLLLYSRVLTV